MNKIIIAVPRGRITKECKKILMKTSFAPDPRIASTGSPGAILNKIKTNEDINHSIKGSKDSFRKK